MIRQPTINYNLLPSDITTGHFVLIRGKCQIGSNVSMGSYTEIENYTIGNNVRIHSHCFIPALTVIEDDVWIGPCVKIANDKYPNTGGKNRKGTIIKKGATIGIGTIIGPGLVIGENSVIGQGSNVIRDVPDNATVVGNPARVIGDKNE